MKTLKSLKLFVIAFMMMFVGGSLSTEATAQVDGSFEYLSEDFLDGSGILSFEVEEEDGIFKCVFLVDEDVIPVEFVSGIMESTKDAVKEEELTPEEEIIASMMVEEGYSFQYIIKGNKSGKSVKIEASVREALLLARLFENNDESFIYENMPIEEMVALINEAMASEDGSTGCKLVGKKIVFEMKTSKSEYDEMKAVCDMEPALTKKLFTSFFANNLDSDTKVIVDSIKKRGYTFALSIVCNGEKPIIIDLDI